MPLSEKVICPKICGETPAPGAFKKSAINPEEEPERSKEAPKPQVGPPPPIRDDQDENWKEIPRKPGDEYLPQLTPGADGKVNWYPLADMTGTRPTVNKYSISRYSLDEWTAHNNKVLSRDILNEANVIDYDSKSAMMAAFGGVDKAQRDNNLRLSRKAKELFRWKTEVERACQSMSEEVEQMEIDRQRLKGASRVLMLPEAISQECLDLRSNRAVPDLVADLAEQELIKEYKLVSDVRTTLKVTLQKIEEQQAINKAVKHKIEYDWCDKKLAYDVDCLNMGLTTKSGTILFRPGATKFGEYTAPLEYWEHFCRESIQNCEEARQKSIDLRGSLNAILVNGGRKLRMQADKTDMAIAETVAIQTALCAKLEECLFSTVQQIADMEKLIDNLRDSIRKMDNAMKLAQTRLENRNITRGRSESVRDEPHFGLLGEVKKIHDTVTALRAQMFRAEKVRGELLAKRIQLEKDVAAKRKTLNIDRTRCGIIRSHYPSASELAGF